MNAEPLLQLGELELTIHDAPILKHVSLQVSQGEVLGIIGESGSGKSMTALSIMQLLPRGARCRGSVRFGGQELTTLDESSLCELRGSDIGMVFQEPMTALNPVHTIGRQVIECIRLHRRVGRREAQRIAGDTLARVGLPQARFPMSRYPHELSGGQRQRVVIAMAVALRPRLLICDEPTTALDVTTQAGILQLLTSLVRSDGMAMILISHDLAVVADTVDRVAIMRRGEVVEKGEMQTLLNVRQHPYTEQLFEASTHVPDRLPLHARATDKAPTAPVSTAPLLQVEDLVCEYALPRTSLFGHPGVFRAVDGVGFSIARGESLGLVGESGCGKSTLARALLGLAPVQGGRIRLGGTDIDARGDIATPLRRQMQVVFQDPYGSFNPRHRVGRLIAEPLHVLAEPPQGREREHLIARSLERVGLHADDARRFIHEFSGGQRQRIAIARALIIHPALIVLDEAVSALDVSVRATILDLLADLADDYALSYLFISHDLSVVRSITDRVLVMRYGRILEHGPTERVFAAPADAYTRALLAAAPTLPAEP